MQGEFQRLLAYVTGPDARSQTVYTVELSRFRRRLALGAALLRLVLVTRASVRPATPVTAPDGTHLTSHDQRPTTSDAVVGHVPFERHFVTAPGPAGICPLDAERSMPARGYSDLWREWATDGATDASYRESQTVLARILGRSLSLQAIATEIVAAGGEVTPFDVQPAEPAAPVPAATILVVHADGNGGPMVQPPTQAPSGRLGHGQQRTKTKDAVGTGLYSLAPDPRTAQDVVAALRQDADRSEPPVRPQPIDQELPATRHGQAVAMSRLAPRVAQREGPHLPPRVALTDGAEALHQQWLSHCPAHTLVLESIHAPESLWDPANALLGETPPQRPAWVRASLAPLLAGQADAVITALAAAGTDPACTNPQRQAVHRPVGYYRRNRPYMHDDEDLARGWPIGTGVVEGACRHLGNDRMEPSGMR